MFSWLFKKKTDREKLDLQYKRLMVAAYEMSSIDPEQSQKLVEEAEKVSEMINEIDRKSQDGSTDA